jgi:hypothetical protein
MIKPYDKFRLLRVRLSRSTATLGLRSQPWRVLLTDPPVAAGSWTVCAPEANRCSRGTATMPRAKAALFPNAPAKSFYTETAPCNSKTRRHHLRKEILDPALQCYLFT